MLSDRDHRVLAETAEQLRREDPGLAALLDGGAEHRWTTVHLPSGRWWVPLLAVLALLLLFGLVEASLSLTLPGLLAFAVLGLVVRRRTGRGAS